jgi:hypothetical protein
VPSCVFLSLCAVSSSTQPQLLQLQHPCVQFQHHRVCIFYHRQTLSHDTHVATITAAISATREAALHRRWHATPPIAQHWRWHNTAASADATPCCVSRAFQLLHSRPHVYLSLRPACAQEQLTHAAAHNTRARTTCTPLLRPSTRHARDTLMPVIQRQAMSHNANARLPCNTLVTHGGGARLLHVPMGS